MQEIYMNRNFFKNLYPSTLKRVDRFASYIVVQYSRVGEGVRWVGVGTVAESRVSLPVLSAVGVRVASRPAARQRSRV